MKHTTVIDSTREEEIIIYAHEHRAEIKAIEAYIDGLNTELVGYGEGGRIVPLQSTDIHCFLIDDSKVYALTDTERLHVRLPLYAIEEKLGQNFVRINQSCLGNLKKIKRFDTSIGGALMVTFANSHRDYVSRRQLKIVKERMHIKP